MSDQAAVVISIGCTCGIVSLFLLFWNMIELTNFEVAVDHRLNAVENRLFAEESANDASDPIYGGR